MTGIEALYQLKQKIEALPREMPAMMASAFNNLKTLVEDLNIEQLDRGERADGSSLPNYSPVSVMVFGKRPGPMNLHDKGDFWRGITLVVSDEGIDLQGRDLKTEMLQLRYGDDILGLQEQNKEKIEQDYLKEELEADQLPKYFGL